jgi:OOP family OmpA-OmpF porin
MTGRSLGAIWCVLALGLGHAAHALDLKLPPSAAMTRETATQTTSIFVPTGPYAEGRIPSIEIEGQLVRQAWQFEATGLSSLQIMRPLRDQVVAAGQDILLDCAGQECGGFDFRFQIDVLPAPDMFVDLFDFRFLSARSDAGDGGPVYTTLLVSRVGRNAYVQVVRVTQTGTAPPRLEVSEAEAGAETGAETAAGAGPVTGAALEGADLATRLQRKGHAVLLDLDFGSGTVALGPGPFASLEALAAFLKEDPERRVALVGHTDTVGGLAGNLRLSRERAQAVLERLATQYGIPRAQLEADGTGYLAPIASNRTPEGREANRRVEVVYLNTR